MSMSTCEESPGRVEGWENVRELLGYVLARKNPAVWVKKVQNRSRPDKQAKQPEKLQKLSFSMSEMA